MENERRYSSPVIGEWNRPVLEAGARLGSVIFQKEGRVGGVALPPLLRPNHFEVVIEMKYSCRPFDVALGPVVVGQAVVGAIRLGSVAVGRFREGLSLSFQVILPRQVEGASLVPRLYSCARKCAESEVSMYFLIGLNTSARVKPGNEARRAWYTGRTD